MLLSYNRSPWTTNHLRTEIFAEPDIYAEKQTQQAPIWPFRYACRSFSSNRFIAYRGMFRGIIANVVC